MYQDRMGVEEQFEGAFDTTKFVSRKEFDSVLAELRVRLERSEGENEQPKAGKKEEVAKTADDEELAIMLGMMNR